MTLKRDDDGKFPSYYSSCRFCENATPDKDCKERFDLTNLFRDVIYAFHERFWSSNTNNAERLEMKGCPGFKISSYSLRNNKDHFGNAVVRKTPKSWG